METYSADVGQGGGWGPDDQGSLRLSVTFMEMIYLCSRTRTYSLSERDWEGGRAGEVEGEGEEEEALVRESERARASERERERARESERERERERNVGMEGGR